MASLEQEEASAPPQRQRRDKYISKACQACRYRKIKCSGHNKCLNCVDRGTECVYDSERRKRRHKAARRQQSDTRSDGVNNQAGGLISPYHDGYTLPGREFAIEERRVRTPSQTLDGVDAAQYPPDGFLDPQLAVAPANAPREVFCGGGEPRSPAATSYPLRVPPLHERTRFLQQFFVIFQHEYPFLDQRDTEARLSQTLTRLGTDPSNTIAVDSEASSFLALVCAVWALGQSTSCSSTVQGGQPSDRPPGHSMYDTSRKLLQAFDGLQRPSLDTVRCHVLHSTFSLHANMIDVALQSHAVAARLLSVVDPQTRQRRDGQGHRVSETSLWWTVFILDRTLSEISETPYVLRVAQLPEELQAGLGAPQWDGQTCGGLPATVPSPRLLPNEVTAKSTETLYLQVMGYVCHLWDSFPDRRIHSTPARGHRCSLRESALLDAELRVFYYTVPSILKWETRGNREGGMVEGYEAPDGYRRLSILVTTNILRLRLREENDLGTCACFGKDTTDGVKIAHETLGAIVDFKNRGTSGPGLSSIAVAATMALKHSIPLLLDVLNEYSNDHEDPEGISDMIEEGYATLMDLASTCKFAKSAVSFLDSRLFSSEDGMEDPSLEAQVSPSPEYNALSNQEAVQDLFPDEQEDTSLGVNEALGSRARETTGWNSLLDDLEVGYSSLDTNCPERMQGGWTADLGQSLSLLDGAALSLDR